MQVYALISFYYAIFLKNNIVSFFLMKSKWAYCKYLSSLSNQAIRLTNFSANSLQWRIFEIIAALWLGVSENNDRSNNVNESVSVQSWMTLFRINVMIYGAVYIMTYNHMNQTGVVNFAHIALTHFLCVFTSSCATPFVLTSSFVMVLCPPVFLS